jgi:Helix-turn-helix domain
MPPKILAPSSKPPSGRYLLFREREEIALLRAQGCGVRETARRLGRDASTISRELRRNAATRSGGLEYRATTAQWHAERAARRPKPAKLAVNARLRKYVQDRLAGAVAGPGGASVGGPVVPWRGRRHGRRQHRRWARAWSPEQIARRLRLDFPGDETMRISHEAIYQALYVQGRGALRRELTACLRTGRALRVPRARSRGGGQSHVSPEIMISQRPAEVADRAVPGHWEGDLILGLALPGQYSIWWRSKSASAMRAADRCETLSEQSHHDGAPHGRQARRWWRSRNTGRHFSPTSPGAARQGDGAAGKRKPCRSSARADANPSRIGPRSGRGRAPA